MTRFPLTVLFFKRFAAFAWITGMQGAVHSFGRWSAGPGHPIRSSALAHTAGSRAEAPAHVATTPTEIVRQLKLLSDG